MKTPRFLILSEPRTGSNNISYSLNCHPSLEVGNELLHPVNGVVAEEFDSIDISPDNASNLHWLAAADKETRSRVITELFSRVNGFKIHSQHIPVDMILDICREFECSIILTRRLSLFEQAISNFVATARGAWHADEKKFSDEDKVSVTVTPIDFTNWLDSLLATRQHLWNCLKEQEIPVVYLEYETFYAGEYEEKINRLNRVFELIGCSRLGTLSQEDRSIAYKKVEHYLGNNQQKMTPKSSAQQVISNYEEISAVYAIWSLNSFWKNGSGQESPQVDEASAQDASLTHA